MSSSFRSYIRLTYFLYLSNAPGTGTRPRISRGALAQNLRPTVAREQGQSHAGHQHGRTRPSGRARTAISWSFSKVSATPQVDDGQPYRGGIPPSAAAALGHSVGLRGGQDACRCLWALWTGQHPGDGPAKQTLGVPVLFDQAAGYDELLHLVRPLADYHQGASR